MARRKIPHFRLYMQDFRDGTGHMSAAEVGDYIRILIEIYDNDGPLAMSAERLRWAMNCRPGMVEKKIARLVELGKLSIDDSGFLHNGRADQEIEIRRTWRDKRIGESGDFSDISSEKYQKNTEKVSKKSAETPIKSKGAVHSRARPDSRLQYISPDGDITNAPNGAHLGHGAAHPKPGKEFDRWYQAYPIKRSRAAAERAFATARKSASLEDLIAGVERYKATKRPDRDFQYPATWLNGKGWLDEPEPPRLLPRQATGPPAVDDGSAFRDFVRLKAQGN